MGELGSTTVISSTVRLLLMDCFETLVELTPSGYQSRRGITEFLTHFVQQRQIPLVVISDAAVADLQQALDQAGLLRWCRALYHAGNAADIQADGRTLKRLDIPLRDFGVSPAECVFIGDSPFDALAAQHFAVPFIRVPRSEDHTFNFACLITGPSGYSNHAFTRTLLKRYHPQAGHT